MKLKLKEYENPYWTDSSVLSTAGNIAIELSRAAAELNDKKNINYILSYIEGTIKELCNDYEIDYDNLLNHYNEIEKWSNSDSTAEEVNESATHYYDPPEYEDDFEVEGTVSVEYPFMVTAYKSWNRADIEEYLKDNFNDCIDSSDMEILDIDYSWTGPQDRADDLADIAHDEAMLQDGEEATQPNDIAKKEEYMKMVTPNFKVGKKIKEEK